MTPTIETQKKVSFGKIAAISILTASLVGAAYQIKAGFWKVTLGLGYSNAHADSGDCGCGGSTCGSCCGTTEA